MKQHPLPLALIATTLISGVALVYAWTGPSAAPYNNNAPVPINAGNVDQTKSANFVAGGLSSANRLIVQGNTTLGGNYVPRAALDVNGNIITNAALAWSSNLGSYNIGALNIGASTVYGYTSICTGNNFGDCSGSNGVVIGTTNGNAYTNIPNTGAIITKGQYRVYNDGADSLDDGGVYIANAANNRAWNFQPSASGHLALFGFDGSSWGEKFRVLSNGNFGIGTTSPATTLGVGGPITAAGTIRSSTGGFQFPDGTTQTTAATGGQWTTSGANIYNSNTGTVGVGTAGAASGKLQVVTTNDTTPNSVGAWDTRHLVVGQAVNTGGVGISYNNTEGYGIINAISPSVAWRNLVLQSGGGSVGIGTLNPTATLDVVGSTVSRTAIGDNWFGYGNTANYLRGSTYFNGVLYDEGNSAYYVDPASISTYNDLRANILYDNNDTNYYVDPNNAAVVRTAFQAGRTSAGAITPLLALENSLTHHEIFNYGANGDLYVGLGRDTDTSKNNFVLYNLSCSGGCNFPQATIYADNTSFGGNISTSGNVVAGALLRSNNAGNGYVEIGPLNSSWAHFTTDRPAYYMDKPLSVNGNISTYSGKVTLDNSTGETLYGTVRSGDVGVYDPTNTQAIWSMGAAYKLPAGGASNNYGNFYGLGWSYEPDYGGVGNNPQSKPGLSHQLLLMHAGTTRTAIGNGIWTQGMITSSVGGFKFPDGTVQTTAAGTGAFIQNQQAAAQSANAWVSGNIRAGNVVIANQVSTDNGSHLSYGGTTNYLRGNTYANGVYYDENNSAYYVDPASTSIYNDLRANIFYDAANTGYYLQPRATSNINALVAAGTITANAGIADSAGTRMDSGGGWFRTYGSTGWYNQTYGGGWYMTDSTWIRSYGSKAVYMDAGFDTGADSGVGCGGGMGGGTYTFRVCGAAGVGAAAYYYTSDQRLKENIVPLDNSLEKIKQLKGYTFTWKDGGREDVGVIAQEVEKVFPELVKTGADGYKSVEYGNLVAPLIEAVKELANQAEGLAARLFNLENRQTELEKQNETQAQQIRELQQQINELKTKK